MKNNHKVNPQLCRELSALPVKGGANLYGHHQSIQHMSLLPHAFEQFLVLLQASLKVNLTQPKCIP